MSHTSASFPHPGNLAFVEPRKIYKNSSQVSIGNAGDAPNDARFLSETAAFHTHDASAAGPNYERVRPATGFDRLTSNQPHFSFGTGGAVKYETTSMSIMPTPGKSAQNVGRGGSGIEAARSDLGTAYNICNFHKHPNSTKLQPTRAVNETPYWMRHSNDKKVPQTSRRCRFNIITCSEVEKQQLPQHNNPRKIKPPLRSLIAVRPPIS